ncbi:CoA transferase [Streptomyces sp. NPDC003236]
MLDRHGLADRHAGEDREGRSAGRRHRGRAYTCSDNLAALHSGLEMEWATLCRRVSERPELIDAPRFATGPDRVAHRGALPALAGVNDACVFIGHPVLTGRDRWRDVALRGAGCRRSARLPILPASPDRAHRTARRGRPERLNPRSTP